MSRITIFLSVLLFSASAWPWGEEGHRITATIADGLLTSEARASVEDLLEGETLADVSTWADQVRRTDYWADTRPLHYMNVEKGASEMVVLRDCRAGDSVLGALAYYRMVLQSETADKQSRKEALKFLVHFIGDIHQPLHVSYAEDKGGNDVDVRFYGRPGNLHAVWDSLLLKRYATDWKKVAEELQQSLDEETRQAYGSQDPLVWAEESFGYTRTTAYQFDDPDSLGESYYNRNIPVVLLRLKQAGVRMAAVLNSILAP